MHGSIISNAISSYTGGLAGSTNKAPQDVTAPNTVVDGSATDPSLLTLPPVQDTTDLNSAKPNNNYKPDDGEDWSHDDFTNSLKNSDDFKNHFAAQGGTTPTVADNPWNKASTYTPQGLATQALKSLGSTGSLTGDIQKLFSTNKPTGNAEDLTGTESFD